MTRKVEIIDKREFAAAVLNADNKIFVVHVAALAELTTMYIYPSCQAQVVSLTSKKTVISAKYFNFSNVFFLDSTVELLKYTRINNYLINLLDDK